jgi:hypothetical protein
MDTQNNTSQLKTMTMDNSTRLKNNSVTSMKKIHRDI